MPDQNVFLGSQGLFSGVCIGMLHTLCDFGSGRCSVSTTLFFKHQVVVTGDTRYEQVYRRAISVEPDTEFFSGQAIFNRSIFIAGSTYADDEEVILEAYQILRKDAPERLPHLILVPHEPTPERITEIFSVLNQRQLTYRCFSKLDNDVSFERIDVLIIDTVGILAKLYQLADIAFVGGSFHGSVSQCDGTCSDGKTDPVWTNYPERL